MIWLLMIILLCAYLLISAVTDARGITIMIFSVGVSVMKIADLLFRFKKRFKKERHKKSVIKYEEPIRKLGL